MAGESTTANTIMAWSKCDIKIVEEDPTGAFPSSGLTSIGTIKDRSSQLSSDAGEELEAKATGGERVGYEQQEGGFTLTTTVIEPTDELYALLGLGTAGSGAFNVKTHVPGKYFAVEVTPKNKGAKGIKAPHCFISVAPGWGEDTGNEITLNIAILHGAGDYWYQRFTTTQALS